MKKTLGAVTLALLTLTACNSPGPGGPFESSEQLIQAINDHTDLACDPEPIDYDKSEFPSTETWETMLCRNDSRVHFPTSEGTKEFLLDYLEESELSKNEVAYGDEWIFIGEHTDATVIRNALHGSKPNFQAVRTPQEKLTLDVTGFEISCRNEDFETTGEFASFEEAWDELDESDRVNCDASWAHSDQLVAGELHDYTDTELEAIETSGYDDKSSITTLYGQCAASYLGDYKNTSPWSEGQAEESQGALVLCPDHPERSEVEYRIAAGAEAEAQKERGERFHSGTFKVGEDVQPGIYVVDREDGFEGCYWERLDSAGNIIQNNFIRNGFRAEVTISASDYSFSSSKCGEWVKQ